MQPTLPKIYNYKISFRTNLAFKQIVTGLKIGENGVLSVKLLHNYAVLKACGYVYSLNYSGFANVTSLKSQSDIDRSIKVLCKLARIPLKQFPYKIDNITASGTFGAPISLHRLQKYFTGESREGGGECSFTAQFTYNPNFFCGANLKYFGDGGGTIIIFTTGSYTVVGAKCINHVNEIYEQTKQMLSFM